MLVSIYTNEVQGGWYPQQKFLGGSEEAVVMFSSTLIKLGYDVEVYSSTHAHTEYEGVHYYPRTHFDFSKKYETLITFKDNLPWRLNTQAKKKIHWSTAVEDKWSDGVLDKIDAFICISRYHLSRVFTNGKGKVIHLGIGLDSISKNKTPKKKNTILYCSSPDRGLQTLLSHWSQIQGYELLITYHKMFEINLPNVKHIGPVDRQTFEQLMWSCEYWIHTLNKPDAELFCLNAIKARATETKAIINNPYGSGLEDTVMEYIPFSEFLKGSTHLIKNKNCNTGIRTWEEIIKSNWIQLLEV